MLMIAFPAAAFSLDANTRSAELLKFRTPASQLAVGYDDDRSELELHSSAALVVSSTTGTVILGKNIDVVHSIASLTKLMTALVLVDAKLSLDTTVRIESEDIDFERASKSKLRIGETLPRRDLLRLALLASENRAAMALARTSPGGTLMFVATMNLKAAALGMENTRFVDASGLSSANVSTARDLAKLVAAAAGSTLIQEFSTTSAVTLTRLDTGQQIVYRNTNLLLRRENDWTIHLSKTGYINEAGHCLVLQATIDQQLVNIVLLDSWGRYSRIGDANRIKKWLQRKPHLMLGKL
ncbi:MAG: serine hydrolase [Burkholderiales bacterium]